LPTLSPSERLPAVSADYLKCHRRQSGDRLWAPTGAGVAAATPPSERATGDGKSMSDLHDGVFAISPDIRYVAVAHGQQVQMRSRPDLIQTLA